MFRSPVGRAVVTVGLTVTAFGAGTTVLSMATIAGVKTLTGVQKRKFGINCGNCKGEGKISCEICTGSGVLDWSPFPDPVVQRLCVCPACDGKHEQKCFNCFGKGVVVE
uniref:Plastid transcriptionally active 5 isoform 1 n=1 Tax=Tetraselmis sp. GSL018 TaxID=582737 RepID=A0A061RGE2_9CHLO